MRRVAYTSIANADHSTNPLQPEHKATEDVLRASGLPFTILRDNWYLENYSAQLPQYLATGEVLGIDGTARIGAATRADMAAAIAAALLDPATETRRWSSPARPSRSPASPTRSRTSPAPRSPTATSPPRS